MHPLVYRVSVQLLAAQFTQPVRLEHLPRRQHRRGVHTVAVTEPKVTHLGKDRHTFVEDAQSGLEVASVRMG